MNLKAIFRYSMLQQSCKSYVLPSQLQVITDFAGLSNIDGKGACSIFCRLYNPTGQSLNLDRREFFLRSAKGIVYLQQPFVSVDSTAKVFRKKTAYPDLYPVEFRKKPS